MEPWGDSSGTHEHTEDSMASCQAGFRPTACEERFGAARAPALLLLAHPALPMLPLSRCSHTCSCGSSCLPSPFLGILYGQLGWLKSHGSVLLEASGLPKGDSQTSWPKSFRGQELKKPCISLKSATSSFACPPSRFSQFLVYTAGLSYAICVYAWPYTYIYMHMHFYMYMYMCI